MCGICGFFRFGEPPSALKGDEPILRRMRDSLIHRGPDDAGLWLERRGRVGFGHRRLSIVDLSPAGRQPMSNEDGAVWITFNGEIYNHRGLRGPLEAKGHRYVSATDTETILHLYEEEGDEMPRRLDGMFAFALYDARSEELLLVRDRIGVKPLYYAVVPGGLLFASEIKAILAHPSMSATLDLEAFYHYLTFVSTPAPLTLFAGIRKLRPGTMLKVGPRGNLREQVWWDAIVPGTLEREDEEEICAEILRLLEEAVRKRMMSDVPFGVYLSGGIDSSANVALMAKLMDRPVRTFSVGFENQPSYNELEEARAVARRFGCDHHEVVLSARDLQASVPELIHHQDEPLADWVCVPLFHLARQTRDSGTVVVQVGEGSDEQFFGYPGYLSVFGLESALGRPLRALPSAARGWLRDAGEAAARWLGRGGDRLELLRCAAAARTSFWGGAIAFRGDEKLRILSPAARDRCRPLDSYHVVEEIWERIARDKPESDFGERMVYLELKQRLAELLLMRVDKMTMAAGIEARVPFLDYRLVEYTMRIPTRRKIRGGVPKYLLKRALRNVLPEEVLHRRKMGFGAPVSEWFAGELARYAESVLMSSRIRELDLLDYEVVGQLLREHREGRRDRAFLIWNLFNLSRWYDYWVAGLREAA
ncbi:MAG TPA: asparagine synthase (glutamine-hydrolyzing) [Candidatus Polarisedimenticolia bacterium]|nr:asparagine synthase (glutamine-hydrolyzing) [Candidatus Polarisedimenticolia bacterium]